VVTLSPGRSRVRRPLAALVAAGVVVATAALGTPSATAAEKVQVGLFGTQDPTYDGVFRQSLSLLAYAAAGQEPPAEAVGWLLDQQCADGGFQAFRADTSKPCTESDPVNYVGEDSNSTALASAALTVLGELDAADGALAWLESAQNDDGGFPYFLGGTSDANSTAIALLATNAVGLSPTQVRKGAVSAADYLTGLQVGCEGAATDEDGGFAYAGFAAGTANDSATVQATVGLSGAALPFVADAPSLDIPRADCPAPAATASASPEAPALAPAAVAPSAVELAGGYIARTLAAYGNAIPELDFGTGERKPGTVSAGDTAWAVLALSAVGVGGAQRDPGAPLAPLGAVDAPETAACADVLADIERTSRKMHRLFPGAVAVPATIAGLDGSSPGDRQVQCRLGQALVNSTVTDVLMPPRALKSPMMVMRRGWQTLTRSSRIWLVAAS